MMHNALRLLSKNHTSQGSDPENISDTTRQTFPHQFRFLPSGDDIRDDAPVFILSELADGYVPAKDHEGRKYFAFLLHG
jgi:hypothetical protein